MNDGAPSLWPVVDEPADLGGVAVVDKAGVTNARNSWENEHPRVGPDHVDRVPRM